MKNRRALTRTDKGKLLISSGAASHVPLPTRRQVLAGLGMSGFAALGCAGGAETEEPAAGDERLRADDEASRSSAGSPSPAASSSREMREVDSAAAMDSDGVPSGERGEAPLAEAQLEPSDVESLEPSQEPSAQGMRRTAFDSVPLGNTGIVTSRLAMGTGTSGYNGSSAQTRMGQAFVQLLVEGHERGIRLFDTADAYGTHSLVGEAMQQVGRQNVTLLTKTLAETAQDAEADLDRFMSELQTDYLDIVLLHIRQSGNWVEQSQGAMEVLERAKQAGRIRAHGVSCHGLAPLQAAAETDWVDVHLARINPFELHMDSDPQTVIALLDQMKAKGRGVLGMKILGAGDAVDRFDECIEHATRLDCIHGFTIGFRSIQELDQVARRMAATTMPA